VLSTLVSKPIYELIPLANAREDAAALPAGAPVTVTASPRLGIDATLDLSAWLSARGHDVSPHLAARAIRNRAHLRDLLQRMRAARLHKVFIVGGDGEPIGEIRDGLTLLRALDEIGHPFEHIGVPAYPEGHLTIPTPVLMQDLREKQPYVDAMTTQMSFNPTAVAAWIGQIRREGISLPIHLGVPGAVELLKLTRIAARIGVADSMRYLMKHRSLLGHLTHGGSFGPDAFLRDLAPMLADPIANVAALHVFTMNQVAATVAWQQKMLAEISQGGPT
jgi:methylenetetrahydrofolate reductase (NADH)